MLPDEQTSPEQFAIFRRMTPDLPWQAVHLLYGDHEAAQVGGKDVAKLDEALVKVRTLL